MKFPTIEEMAKDVAEKAFDEYEYQGKTIRQWVEVLKDYDDKQATLQRIVERLEVKKGTVVIDGKKMYQEDYFIDIDEAIAIVREEGGLNET